MVYWLKNHFFHILIETMATEESTVSPGTEKTLQCWPPQNDLFGYLVCI